MPDPGQEHLTVHGSREHPRRPNAVQPHGGDERLGFVSAEGNMADQALADGRSTAPAGHFGVGAAFIHEQQPGAGHGGEPFVPPVPLFGHVGPLLLGGVHRFFYSSAPGGATTDRPSTFQTAGPTGSPVQPAWRRDVRPPAFAGGFCAVRSEWSCGRTSGFGAPASRGPRIAGAPAEPPPRSNRTRMRSPPSPCRAHTVSGCVLEPAQVWISCPHRR